MAKPNVKKDRPQEYRRKSDGTRFSLTAAEVAEMADPDDYELMRDYHKHTIAHATRKAGKVEVDTGGHSPPVIADAEPVVDPPVEDA